MRLFGRRRGDEVRGEARIVEMAPTTLGARQTEKYDISFRFVLDVTSSDRPPWTVEFEQKVPHAKMPLLGDRVPVLVSTADPAEVRVDWDAAPDLVDRFQASADAAKRGDVAGAAEALGFSLAAPPPDDESTR